MEIVLAYLRAIETRGDVAAHLHTDVQVTEHPNRVTPAGKRYDRAAILAANDRGRQVMASERYVVRSIVVDGDRVALQVEWTGTLVSGPTMTAQIATFIELKDGKIWRQEQYDCFQ